MSAHPTPVDLVENVAVVIGAAQPGAAAENDLVAELAGMWRGRCGRECDEDGPPLTYRLSCRSSGTGSSSCPAAPWPA